MTQKTDAEVYTTIMIIMITLTDAIQDFDSLLTAPRTVSKTYAQVARVKWRANHMIHIGRHVVCHTVQRTTKLLSLTEFKSHLS